MDHNALEQEAKAAKVVDATQTINMNGEAFVQSQGFQNHQDDPKVDQGRRLAASTQPKPLLSLLLEAEMATLVDPQAISDAREMFDQAIVDASEFQNVGLEAMANERAARYSQFYTPDQDEARWYMNRALELCDY